MGKSEIYFTRHAMRRMKWRGISKTQVESALQKPDKIETSAVDRVNAYKTISGKLLKVTAARIGNATTVITAVWKGE